ncbi:hypothetical protein, partial [Escherichia coli]|uniref:hypothetical protein n=1 Tax=Escherichia coli TaxID=562 RepID=UPI001962F126
KNAQELIYHKNKAIRPDLRPNFIFNPLIYNDRLSGIPASPQVGASRQNAGNHLLIVAFK